LTKITKAELKKKIEGVMEIAPYINTSNMHRALLEKYQYVDIEEIMDEIDKEKLASLMKAPATIMVKGNKSLEEVVKNAERKKKKKLEEEREKEKDK